MTFLPLLFVLGCGQPAGDGIRIEYTIPDAPPGTGSGQHTQFDTAFGAERVVVRDGATYTISGSVVGSIAVDGPVVFTDILADTYETLPVSISKGSYPVEVSRARITGADGGVQELVAAARLVIRDRPATTWDYVATIVSNSGTVGLCGQKVGRALSGGTGSGHIKLRAAEDPVPWWIDTVLGPDPDFALVPSGYGEGAFDVYVGYDTDGDVVTVIIDFGVLMEAVSAEHEFGDLLAYGEGRIEIPGLLEHGVKVTRTVGDAALVIDASNVSADPTFGNFELIWLDDSGEPMWGGSQVYGSKHTFRAPRNGIPAQAVLRWVAGVRPL